MYRLLFVLCLAFFSSNVFALLPAITDKDTAGFFASGACGLLEPGIGLGSNGKGWVHSPIPGPTEFRIPNGEITLTISKIKNKADFDAGRQYLITVTSTSPMTELEWKIPGYEWGKVPKAFLYPIDQSKIYKRPS